uniref:Ig-like domain-containing protein n=1 Tax=Poecilia latipinna TaxID=48699 RepID=A0A3B3U740_9TELE
YVFSSLFCPCLILSWLHLLNVPISENFTVSAKPHVSVQRGHTAILPCWLTFSESAEDMEVRWDHWNDDYDPPVLLYQAGAFDFSSQKASYAGRVSLGLKEETSGGLKAGDVSLKLEKATIEDAGKYTCFVSSSDDYDSATISLSVTAVMKDHNKVNMSCQSDGWHPKPELSWSDGKTALTPADVMFSKNSAGFYSVHSWVLVSSPSEVSCSVGLFNEEPKEARMRGGFWECSCLFTYVSSVLFLYCLSYVLCSCKKKRGHICIVDISISISDPSVKLFDNKNGMPFDSIV